LGKVFVLIDWVAARMRNLRGWRRLLTAVIAGASATLAFPPFGFFPLLLLSYAAFVLMLDGAVTDKRPLRSAAVLGWGYGFGFFAAGLHWIGYAFLVDADAHLWLLPFAVLLMPSGLALFYALAGALYVRFWRADPRRVLMFAAMFGTAEWLRGHIFTGFPWNLPAYGWGESLAILQSTATFGAYGLSLLTLLFGASLALLADRPRGWAHRIPLAMAILFSLLWVHGTLRLAYGTDDVVPEVRLRIVQPNTPQSEKYLPAFVPRNWQRLIDLTMMPAEIPPTHVIWPEAAPPFVLMREPQALRQVAAITANLRALMMGAVRIDEDENGPRFYNSFYVFGPNANLLATYDKFHLVPFGEYLPFEETLNALGITQIGGGSGSFSVGPGPQTLEVPGAPPVSALICYEIIFPGAVSATPRPAWLVNMTDDSWFGPAAGPRQHLLIARVRAIEEGLPLIRAANGGISAIVDPYGRIRAQLDLGLRGVLDGDLPTALPRTLYVRFANKLYLILVLICILVALSPLRVRRA